MQSTSDLNQLWQQIWRELEGAVLKPEEAFRTPVFGTVGKQGVQLRTVVLRRVEASTRSFFCYTDARSEKIGELHQNFNVSWLFYSPERKIQIRADGIAKIHHQDAVALEAWQSVPLFSRRAYCTEVAPGTKSGIAASGLPEALVDRAPSEAESETGYTNFAVIVSTIRRVDWLHLDSKGHSRAEFSWNEKRKELVSSWIIP